MVWAIKRDPLETGAIKVVKEEEKVCGSRNTSELLFYQILLSFYFKNPVYSQLLCQKRETVTNLFYIDCRGSVLSKSICIFIYFA